MKLILIFYILNTTILLLHELESAYEREWEILNLPGKITGFLILHIPIIILLLWGILEIAGQSLIGFIIGIITGIGGFIPFFIHKILVKRKDRFTRFIPSFLLYLNMITGLGTLILSILFLYSY